MPHVMFRKYSSRKYIVEKKRIGKFPKILKELERGIEQNMPKFFENIPYN